MTTSQRCGEPGLQDGSLIPATFQSVHRCPARSDYIELCFETDESPWAWCLPEPSEHAEYDGGCDAVAITVGPYGAQARCVDGDRLGFALPGSEAVPLILNGIRTLVARKLVERGW